MPSPPIRSHRGRPTTQRPTRARQLIDVVLMLDLLSVVVAERGDDFVYSPVGEPVHDNIHELRRDALSLAGEVLSLAGASPDDLKPVRRHSIRDLYASGRLPVPLTLGAAVVLHAAEHSQNCGKTWGEAADHARRMADRFIDLLPDQAMHGDPRAPTHTGRTLRGRHRPRRVAPIHPSS
jgi:hypothetical protein